MSRWLSIRWVIDRLVAVILQLLLSPVLGLVSLAAWLADGGRPIIRVSRVGRDHQLFGMFKIRTMTAVTAAGLSDGPAISGSRDARVTALGRRLRRWRLDELPQLLNVALGEMSLIGPRPEAPDFVDELNAVWRHVLRARPGIAGPTQLMVHDWEARVLKEHPCECEYREVVLPVKLAIDGWYVEHASPWIDVLVVAALFHGIVGGRRESPLEARVRRCVPEAQTVPSRHVVRHPG